MQQLSQIVSDRTFRLLTPLLIFNGFEQVFIYADFNKSYVACALQVHTIGFTMIAVGLTSALTSLGFDFGGGKLPREVLIGGGSVLHIGLLILMLIWEPESSQPVPIYFIAVFLGVCDAVWITQANVLLGTGCFKDSQVAFVNFRMLQSLGAALAFGLSCVVCFEVKIYIMLCLLVLSIATYVTAEYRIRKQWTEKLEKQAQEANLQLKKIQASTVDISGTTSRDLIQSSSRDAPVSTIMHDPPPLTDTSQSVHKSFDAGQHWSAATQAILRHLHSSHCLLESGHPVLIDKSNIHRYHCSHQNHKAQSLSRSSDIQHHHACSKHSVDNRVPRWVTLDEDMVCQQASIDRPKHIDMYYSLRDDGMQQYSAGHQHHQRHARGRTTARSDVPCSEPSSKNESSSRVTASRWASVGAISDSQCAGRTKHYRHHRFCHRRQKTFGGIPSASIGEKISEIKPMKSSHSELVNKSSSNDKASKSTEIVSTSGNPPVIENSVDHTPDTLQSSLSIQTHAHSDEDFLEQF